VIADLRGKTAVVTGAASGIGFALAERFVDEGMQVALADVEEPALVEAAAKLRAAGGNVLAEVTDVSDGDSVDRLARAVANTFGPVQVLCNNAGVGAGGLVSELSTADWEWVLDVNLWGVIHGVRAFLPGMLASGEPGHVVNTASLAGLVSAPFMAPYSASKFAVVATSEALFHELRMTGAKVGVSVLCPGWVNTNIHSSERNRPARAGRQGDMGVPDGRAEMLRQILQNGMPPAEVAQLVVDAVRTNRFYILTHPEMTPAIEARMTAIVEGHDPSLTGQI